MCLTPHFELRIDPSLPTKKQVAADQLPKLAALRDRLTERLASVPGAAVEDNVFSVSVHYRNCDPGDVQAVRWSALARVLHPSATCLSVWSRRA